MVNIEQRELFQIKFKDRAYGIYRNRKYNRQKKH